MTNIEDLKNMLKAHGLDTEEYTDAMLNSLIMEAKLLINEPYMFDEINNDYEIDFNDNTFMTSNYPVKTNSVKITINEKPITPTHITSEGLIYLDKTYHGKLKCTYTVGLNTEDIQQYLLPITVNMIKDNQGRNISSINEGDVSISYDNNNSTSTQINTLIENLKSKYSGRCVFI